MGLGYKYLAQFVLLFPLPPPPLLHFMLSIMYQANKSHHASPLFAVLKAGAVSQAKGSCYMEMKNTKVICAVYGPREVPRRDGFIINGQLRCEFKFATFASEVRHGHLTSHPEKDLALQVQQALEPAVCLVGNGFLT